MISKVHGAFILLLVAIVPAKLAAETFVYSGGCFWCTEADSEKYLITKGTLYKKYSYDNLSTPTQSAPATLSYSIPSTSGYIDALNLTNNSSGVDFSALNRDELSDMFEISVDGSSSVSIGLEHLAGSSTPLSGTGIAFELTNILNERFGDGKKFDVSAYWDGAAATPASTGVTLDITRDLGESNQSFLQVDVGDIIGDAIAAGDVVINLGGDSQQDNYLEIYPGWNATLRIYNPKPAYFDGSWARPELELK